MTWRTAPSFHRVDGSLFHLYPNYPVIYFFWVISCARLESDEYWNIIILFGHKVLLSTQFAWCGMWHNKHTVLLQNFSVTKEILPFMFQPQISLQVTTKNRSNKKRKNDILQMGNKIQKEKVLTQWRGRLKQHLSSDTVCTHF